MSKKTELEVLSKGYMRQEKELKEKDNLLAELQSTRNLLNELDLQGDASGADIKVFIARAKDKIAQLTQEIDDAHTETRALQRSLATISVELSNAQQSNSNMVEENTKLRELVANTRGDMYEMLHNESKDNLSELAKLKSENVGMVADVARLERELADSKKYGEQVPNLVTSVEEMDKELASLRDKVKSLEKENKLYRAKTTTEVSTDDGSDMLLTQ